MCQKFLPNVKSNNSYPVSTVTLNFFEHIFKDASFNGFVNLAIRNESGDFSNLGFIRVNLLQEYISKMCLYPTCDYYLSANTFCKTERSKETLFSLNNIVLDIDCHNGNYHPHELPMLIESLAWRLKNDCFACGDIPEPNYIILTGRGVHLWWALVPSYASAFGRCITDIKNHFISIIKSFLNEFETELGMFDVDTSASLKPEGLFRLPGSYNTKTGTQTEAIFLNDTMLNPQRYRDHALPEVTKKTDYKKFQHRFISSDLQGHLEHRVSALEQLRELRSAAVGYEMRNNYCYVIYSLLKAICGHEEAYQRTLQFNEGFLCPLSIKELRSTLSSAIRKDYKFSTEKLIDIFDISTDEARSIGLYKATSSTNSFAIEKRTRDNKVIELYNQGLSQSAIAEEMKINRKTIASVIKRNPESCQALSEKILLLHQQGVKTSDIAHELNCSIRTVQRHLRSATIGQISSQSDKLSISAPIYGYTLKEMGKSMVETEDEPKTESIDAQIAILMQELPLLSENRLSELRRISVLADVNTYRPFYDGHLTFQENDVLADVNTNAPVRLKAAILATLQSDAETNCNMCVETKSLYDKLVNFLENRSAKKHTDKTISYSEFRKACSQLTTDKKITMFKQSDTTFYYLTTNYILESQIIDNLRNLLTAEKNITFTEHQIVSALKRYEVEVGFRLSNEQKNAVKTALTTPMSIITGGPGTGKTSVLDAICNSVTECFPASKIKLCAPTGKASARMTEATGYPASTVHSLLSHNQIDCDFLVVDEASMMNADIFCQLLEKLSPTSRLILVGDTKQLPCIGVGNILHDLIASKKVKVTSLRRVFRQAKDNDIAHIAHHIASSKTLETSSISSESNISGDFFYCNVEDATSLVDNIISVISQLKDAQYPYAEIQVLSPTRSMAAAINNRFQSLVHGNTLSTSEEFVFSAGDRVIYTKNDYGKNLFNGATGIVASVNKTFVSVRYGNIVVRHYNDDLENLELAYALSVHKAQGSEYPIVIIPLHESMGRVLSKNLLYTAITRAKKKCILVGSQRAIDQAMSNDLDDTHFSLLAKRLASDG